MPVWPRIVPNLTVFGPTRWRPTKWLLNKLNRRTRQRQGDFMIPQKQETVVRQHVVVDVPINRAFGIFTEKFDLIKPREHNMLAVDIAETVFEARVGGSIYDRGVDGSICRFARVLVYEPPHRVLFSWDIDPQWQIEKDPNRTSEVEVRFISETPNRTRVELEHRNLDRHGEGWEGLRQGLDSEGGWPLYLQRFGALARD
jgi:uncharacterized protein YndB with AHSA1/START domain